MSSLPGTLHRLTIHGHEVTCRVAGEGPALLLIHGMAGSARTWSDALPLLAEHHTVVAPDLLGHGESAKPAGDYSLGAFASGLRGVLAVLGIDRVTVVGQSLGGGVAMQLVYQHPELAERLVLVCSGGLGREVSPILRLLSMPGMELAMPVLFPRPAVEAGNAVSRWLRDAGLRAPRAAEMWRAYSSLAEPESRAAFVRTLRAVVDLGGQTVSATDRLYLASGLPTLLVWGEDDPIIPVAHARAAHELIAGSRLEVFERCGHFPHSEQPVRFAQVLHDFIASTDAAEAADHHYRSLLAAHARDEVVPSAT